MRLMRNIRPCIGRRFGEVKYYVTQVLLGHGLFRKYLHRISKTASYYCLYEEGEIIDIAEYTVFGCARWQSYRSELTSTIGTITAANIVGVMIPSRENLASMVNYVERILLLKKGDLEATEHVSGRLENNGTRARRYTKQRPLLNFRYAIRTRI